MKFTACSENIVRHTFFFFFGNACRELGADEALGETIVHAPPEVCLERKGHILCRVRCLRKTQLEQVLCREQQHMHEGLQQVRVPALVSAPHTQRTPDSCTVPSPCRIHRASITSQRPPCPTDALIPTAHCVTPLTDAPRPPGPTRVSLTPRSTPHRPCFCGPLGASSPSSSLLGAHFQGQWKVSPERESTLSRAAPIVRASHPTCRPPC